MRVNPSARRASSSTTRIRMAFAIRCAAPGMHIEEFAAVQSRYCGPRSSAFYRRFGQPSFNVKDRDRPAMWGPNSGLPIAETLTAGVRTYTPLQRIYLGGVRRQNSAALFLTRF